jgi:hypothetical protein
LQTSAYPAIFEQHHKKIFVKNIYKNIVYTNSQTPCAFFSASFFPPILCRRNIYETAAIASFYDRDGETW